MSPDVRSRPAGPGWTAALFAALALFLLGLWIGARFLAPGADAPADTEAPVVEAPTTETPATAEPAPPAPIRQEPVEVVTERSTAAGGGARIALLVDDLGRSVRDLDRLAALGVPISCAVLPYETRTFDVVHSIHSRGWELLLHLPMEPLSGADPGPGALTSDMSSVELRDATLAALNAVPGAIGVNNHMGSILSTDHRSMAAVLTVVGENGLFWVDSRTSAESVGYRQALEMGVPSTERQVFLDSDPVPDAVEEQFDRLLSVARRRGAALAIGHPHGATLEVLERRIPEAVAAGFEFVPVSFLLDRAAAPPE